jgi:hypothetical protein
MSIRAAARKGLGEKERHSGRPNTRAVQEIPGRPLNRETQCGQLGACRNQLSGDNEISGQHSALSVLTKESRGSCTLTMI